MLTGQAQCIIWWFDDFVKISFIAKTESVDIRFQFPKSSGGSYGFHIHVAEYTCPVTVYTCPVTVNSVEIFLPYS